MGDRPPQSAITGTDQELRAALVVLLRKMSEPQKEKSLDGMLLLTALLPVLATFVTLWISGRREDRQAENDREKTKLQFEHELKKQGDAAVQGNEQARIESALEFTAKKVALRRRQLEDFYAPLWALLQQSEGVYDKLREQLAADSPQLYKLMLVEGRTRPSLQIKSGDRWEDFRLLDIFPTLKTNPRYDALIKEVIRVGKQMHGIISSLGGLELEPSPVYGAYVAHYRVLCSLYENTETKACEPGSQISGYYPRELNDVVKRGYDLVNAYLQNFEKVADKVAGLTM